MDRSDVIVIGAGVIGLGVAREFALAGRSVIVVERHGQIGSETSSRNSGVIHSGIYYPTGSLKARLCVRGRELLYAYCRERHVGHRACGKLIVAQAAEVTKLERLQATALQNGVTDLQWLDAAGIHGLEPAVRAAAGLWCPSTGIVDVHEYMTALHGDIENAGGVVALHTTFLDAHRSSDGFRIRLSNGGSGMELECGILVNAAGLAGCAVLGNIAGYPAGRVPTPHFAKGNYFEYTGRSPFTHLVYPMPSEAGLGVHCTLDLGGALRFGPDVEWLESPDTDFDYSVREDRGEIFYGAIREYWPDLPNRSLRASYSGVRPKLVGPGSPAQDFRIEGPADHGVAGLVTLLGMESPGLTASLAVAEMVLQLATTGDVH